MKTVETKIIETKVVRSDGKMPSLKTARREMIKILKSILRSGGSILKADITDRIIDFGYDLRVKYLPNLRVRYLPKRYKVKNV